MITMNNVGLSQEETVITAEHEFYDLQHDLNLALDNLENTN